MIHFLAPADEVLIRNYLDVRGASIAHHFRIIDYENLPQEFRGGTYLFAALEQLSAPMERLTEELYAQLSRCEGVRILNTPGRTLRRYELLRELARLGRNDFRAVRANDDLRQLRFPVFVRAERTHEGALSPLLHSLSEVEAWIGRNVLLGRAAHELLVVEFCDTRDANGFYRKYAAFNVGGRIVAKSLDYGSEWMLKRQTTEYSREMLLEEHEYVRTNPHERDLAEIFAIAKADYGRIDYAMKDGEIRTWEINLHPTAGRARGVSKYRAPNDLERIQEQTKEVFHQRFREAWLAIDIEDDRVLPVSLDGALIAAARRAPAPQRPRGPLVARVRKALRPLKPLLLRRGASLFRLFGSLARRRRTDA